MRFSLFGWGTGATGISWVLRIEVEEPQSFFIPKSLVHPVFISSRSSSVIPEGVLISILVTSFSLFHNQNLQTLTSLIVQS